jgi:hypothetical protein
MTDRPSRASDGLGPYKLMPKAASAFTIDADDQARLCTYLGIDQEGWDRNGSVIVDCFDWWATEKYTGAQVTLAERTILAVILEEFEMYHAHLRFINKKPNYGWLRNMYHSLGQQVMRQDPKYFAIYCALRPDRNTNLVSYPYYAKYAHKGDNTFFRHIDVNKKQLASSGRGANMIQGTVSLDNENQDDCTEILPGMHKHIKEWDEILTARGLSSAALVHRIEGNMFTQEDEKRFATKWTPLSHVSADRCESLFRICRMGRAVLPKVNAATCSLGFAAYRVILKRSKWSKVARGPNCPPLIGI